MEREALRSEVNELTAEILSLRESHRRASSAEAFFPPLRDTVAPPLCQSPLVTSRMEDVEGKRVGEEPLSHNEQVAGLRVLPEEIPVGTTLEDVKQHSEVYPLEK